MEPKRLYRTEKDRMIAGVCGGLAKYFNIDPTIVRLVFALLFLTGSAGFWLYLIMWVIVPTEPVAMSGPIEPYQNDQQQ